VFLHNLAWPTPRTTSAFEINNPDLSTQNAEPVIPISGDRQTLKWSPFESFRLIAFISAQRAPSSRFPRVQGAIQHVTGFYALDEKVF
jgi:hypothetical protein